MLSRSLIVLAVVGVCYAATWRGYQPQKPFELAHKEGCYVKEINEVIPFGTSVTPIGFCYQIHCDRLMVDYASCGVVNTEDSSCYKTGEDLSLPYPSCCPSIECEEDNKI